MKDNFLGLQALAKNLVLFSCGLQLVSRPFIFTVLNLNKVYFPLADIELCVHLHWVVLGAHLVQMRNGWRFEFFAR